MFDIDSERSHDGFIDSFSSLKSKLFLFNIIKINMLC